MTDKTTKDEVMAKVVSRVSWATQVWPVLKHPALTLQWRRQSLDERIRQVAKSRDLLAARIAYEKAAFRLLLPRRAHRQRVGRQVADHRDREAVSARELDGVRLEIPRRERWRDNSYDRRLLTDSRYPLNLSHFRRLLVTGGTMIDIGAHVGTVSIAHALLGDFRRIHAFEPVQENFACLKANIEMNGLDSLVIPHRCALGAEMGEVQVREGTGSGQHQMVVRTAASREDRKVSVALTTLDRVLEEIGRDGDDVSFVKCDAEGRDPDVLFGGRKFLATRRAVWQIEFCPRLIERRSAVSMHDLFDLLEASFGHFIADRGTKPHLAPISSIRETLSQPLSRNHIDIFLIP